MAAVCAGSRAGSSGQTDSAVRSRSAASTNGSSLSPSWQRAASTTPPAACASPRNTSSSRVLPQPAAPSTVTTRPAAPTRCQAAWSACS